ncbi:polysaccharide deacetylase family protein [Shouchella clausii]|uniref:Polysaccharide deacetylase n=1 Tax=Shouchella clausii TaxID=79880 RepID=A0A268P3N4_SHOCL|nr:polysaccharide deacetylase family protein [Shouchella clausii]MDO7267396.1 polysaccharide deacetylase family protein [Shouchella clausii]MDO7287650.1 polysaccharide deacetylase family protein [Shouchella clausii]PAD19435.1 polysaccharide deacetylase [Shouchella clausii]PAE90298.1 polysaccharide deacetylase [Shouchella clausii]
MKKWLAVPVCLLVLTACGNESDNSSQTATEANENERDKEHAMTEDENSSEDLEKPEENEVEEQDQDSEPLYEINSNSWTVEPIEGTDANEKVVLLTIDDAPDAYGLEMAQTLEELDVPAIFFVNGHFIEDEEGADELKQIHDMGFAIGNHTMSHQKLDDVGEEVQQQEIVELNDRIEDVIGERPRFFRAPHGINTEYSRSLVEEEGMLNMNWTYGYDWESEYQSEEAIADIMVHTELLTNGANLLMHDREWTAGALEEIVTGLRDKGYDFVDPAQLN